ncbi:MAG: type II toxin-antitoxin system RelE/ParE family toxin [Dehalococcoidia bacterium]|nr:type II toxin-antitoxin system RelE/ParE family toxin [Dehalococcoidia bacterium]
MAWLTRTFTSDAGGKPVEEWIVSLHPRARAEVMILVELLETHGTNLREPFVRHIEDGIWELRARAPDGIYRVLYFHMVRPHIWAASWLHDEDAKDSTDGDRYRSTETCDMARAARPQAMTREESGSGRR